jgi:hypothetical protein
VVGYYLVFSRVDVTDVAVGKEFILQTLLLGDYGIDLLHATEVITAVPLMSFTCNIRVVGLLMRGKR